MATVPKAKGRQISERVLKMKDNFISLHDEGYTIPEIAQKFNLSKITIYRYLEEIAEANGRTREELLQCVHKTPKYWEREQKRVHVDLEELNHSFDEADDALTDALTQIDNILGQMEE